MNPLMLPSCSNIRMGYPEKGIFRHSNKGTVQEQGKLWSAAFMQYHKNYFLTRKPFLYNVRSANPKT